MNIKLHLEAVNLQFEDLIMKCDTFSSYATNQFGGICMDSLYFD